MKLEQFKSQPLLWSLQNSKNQLLVLWKFRAVTPLHSSIFIENQLCASIQVQSSPWFEVLEHIQVTTRMIYKVFCSWQKISMVAFFLLILYSYSPIAEEYSFDERSHWKLYQSTLIYCRYFFKGASWRGKWSQRELCSWCLLL